MPSDRALWRLPTLRGGCNNTLPLNQGQWKRWANERNTSTSSTQEREWYEKETPRKSNILKPLAMSLGLLFEGVENGTVIISQAWHTLVRIQVYQRELYPTFNVWLQN